MIGKYSRTPILHKELVLELTVKSITPKSTKFERIPHMVNRTPCRYVQHYLRRSPLITKNRQRESFIQLQVTCRQRGLKLNDQWKSLPTQMDTWTRRKRHQLHGGGLMDM